MTNRRQARKRCNAVDNANNKLWYALMDGDVNEVGLAYQILIDAMGWLKESVDAVKEDEKADITPDPAIAKSVSAMSAAMARSGDSGQGYVGRTHALGSRRI